MNEIWTKRDRDRPKQARKFKTHNPGSYSRKVSQGEEGWTNSNLPPQENYFRKIKQGQSIGTR